MSRRAAGAAATEASGETAARDAPTMGARRGPQPVSWLPEPLVRGRLWNLPNLLSGFRILLVPALVVALLTKYEGKEIVALALFLLASLTDFLDGYLARRWNLVTRLGKLLDPAADKILTSAALISLVELGIAPAWMVAVLVAREFAVSSLRGFLASERIVVAAGLGGKLKTIALIVAISLLILAERFAVLTPAALGALWVALAFSPGSATAYLLRLGPVLSLDEERSGPPPE